MSFRVPYLVGNTRLRDHQFWPTILRSELNDFLISQGQTDTNSRHRFIDQFWPVPVSLETIMQMAWRVREWTISGGPISYVGSQAADLPIQPEDTTWSMTATFEEFLLKAKRLDEDDNLRDVTDERDLLGPASDSDNMPEWQTLRNAGVQGETDGDEITVSTSSNSPPYVEPEGKLELLLFGDYTIFDPDTGLFYPQIVLDSRFFGLTISGPDTFGPQTELFTLSTTPIAPPLSAPPFGVNRDVQQGTLTVINPTPGEDNIVIPLGMFGEPSGSAPPFWIQGGTGSVALTMTPTRFWQYATTGGDPVYSETTGEVFNDPFS